VSKKNLTWLSEKVRLLSKKKKKGEQRKNFSKSKRELGVGGNPYYRKNKEPARRKGTTAVLQKNWEKKKKPIRFKK